MKELRLQWLDPDDPEAPFPPVEGALERPNGLLAVGGDLSKKRLLRAYAQGIFPWFGPNEPILWWSPDPRAVFYPDHFYESKRFKRSLRQARYAVTLDQAFERVVKQCSAPRLKQTGTWLGAEMRNAYGQLHKAGYAHSVEVWRQGRLIGGVYGLALGGIFFGESMFSRETNGSKIALTWLARQLAAWDYDLIDGQVGSLHLYRLGAADMPRRQFTALLDRSLRERPTDVGAWAFSLDVPRSSKQLPADLSD